MVSDLNERVGALAKEAQRLRAMVIAVAREKRRGDLMFAAKRHFEMAPPPLNW
jgi:uncharacterized small protein (DUF1192 family)